MLMLTATMPMQIEDEFRRRMGIDQVGIRIFRSRTTRSNIRYGVQRLAPAGRAGRGKAGRESGEAGTGSRGDAWFDAVAALIQQKQRQHDGGKVVVYCQSVPHTKRLAALLQCDAYHHHALDKQIKMEAFRQGRQRVIVSTSAFGMGVDIYDIRAIVHVDEPRSLLDYAQESGRAGRDGVMSEAIIALPEKGSLQQSPLWAGPKDATRDDSARQMVWKYLEEGCHRAVMDRFMDGEERRDGCGS